MLLFIIVLLFLLAAIVLTLYRRKPSLPAQSAEYDSVAPPFSGFLSNQDVTATDENSRAAEVKAKEALERAALIARAEQGDPKALSDAHASRNRSLYSDVLDALVKHASGSKEKLRALASHIQGSDELRANTSLAQCMIEAFKVTTDLRSTTEMLHVAALSDDPATYEVAIDAALKVWQAGKLPQLSAEQLWELIESQHWVLTNEARSSGAGFILKRRLAAVRRQLAGELLREPAG